MTFLHFRSFVCGTLAAACLVISPVEAARDAVSPLPKLGGYEIVVMEVKGCSYCPLVRSDILPVYSSTPRGKAMPMRFLDLNDKSADAIKLKAPITTVPTAVLIQDNVEIGRITGYVGPELFPRMVSDLMLGRN